jgi:2,3-bisphosphoglycerate-dependent phosphoglycerate mutase
MGQLILLRHGQSLWNAENRFTGWVDVDLSDQGINEAKLAGQKLKAFKLNRVFASTLKRAIETAQIVLDIIKQNTLPLTRSTALNERHYGDLQGLNKDEMRIKFGAKQISIWRRSYDIRPPNGESLKDTCNRVLPYYQGTILPCLLKKETVLVVAHGNSLRGLIKELEHLSDSDVVSVEIPTGSPIVYELDKKGQFLSKALL